jgi:hypothetical protein
MRAFLPCYSGNNAGSLTGPVTTLTVVRNSLRFETAADGLQMTNGIVHLRLAGLAGTGPIVFLAPQTSPTGILSSPTRS